jgi:hypothetical protein
MALAFLDGGNKWWYRRFAARERFNDDVLILARA